MARPGSQWLSGDLSCGSIPWPRGQFVMHKGRLDQHRRDLMLDLWQRWQGTISVKCASSHAASSITLSRQSCGEPSCGPNDNDWRGSGQAVTRNISALPKNEKKMFRFWDKIHETFLLSTIYKVKVIFRFLKNLHIFFLKIVLKQYNTYTYIKTYYSSTREVAPLIDNINNDRS